MKIHNKLDKLLSQNSKVKIIRLLLYEKDEHTGRGIAKAINMSASATYKALQEMKDEGLIDVRRMGNAILYKLKEDNYYVRNLLLPLFEKEKSVFSDIVNLIKKILLEKKEGIISVAIFGSVANMKETLESDIDLLIITINDKKRQKIKGSLDELSIGMAKKYRVAISPYVLTKEEIQQKYFKGKPIIKSIMNNNILIYGEPIERILA
jgi:predicted nucleotidyltransferase/biotin operon repressor